MTSKWYVVETEIHGRRDAQFLAHDKAPWRHLAQPYAGMAGAADRIAAAGFPVLFPLERKLEINRRTKKLGVVDRPAFVRFLLTLFDVNDRDKWGEIPRTRGVRGILRLGGEKPVPVRQAVVDELLAKDMAQSALTLDEMLKRQRRPKRHIFPEGASVRMTEGPFANVEVSIRSDSGGDDVRLIVAGWLEVTAPASQVVAA